MSNETNIGARKPRYFATREDVTAVHTRVDELHSKFDRVVEMQASLKATLDERAPACDRRFGVLEDAEAKLHRIVYGNGEKGLVDFRRWVEAREKKRDEERAAESAARREEWRSIRRVIYGLGGTALLAVLGWIVKLILST